MTISAGLLLSCPTDPAKQPIIDPTYHPRVALEPRLRCQDPRTVLDGLRVYQNI